MSAHLSTKKAVSGNVEKRQLNIESINQSLWLVKIPQFVAEQWTHDRNNEIIGSLNVVLKPSGLNSAPTKQLNVKLSNNKKADVPDEFTLEDVPRGSSNADSFIAFTSASSENNKNFFGIMGKVTKNLLLKPQGTKEYRHLIRSRGITKITSRRETHVADAAEVQRCQNQSHTVEFITSEKNELKRKNMESRSASNKMSKSSSGDVGGDAALKSAIFRSFNVETGGSDKLTFKEILANCQNVEGFTSATELRSMLAEYCKYTVRGQFKHFYELKADYRDNYTASLLDDENGSET